MICSTSRKRVLIVFAIAFGATRALWGATEAHSQRIRARFRGKHDAKGIDHINCQQASREAKSLEDGSYHVGMLQAPFNLELTLTVAKDRYEILVKHPGEHLSLN